MKTSTKTLLLVLGGITLVSLVIYFKNKKEEKKMVDKLPLNEKVLVEE